MALRPLSDQARAVLRAMPRDPAWLLDEWFSLQTWKLVPDLTIYWPPPQ